ncbi:hypothetical protein N7527_000709 [Penicillium freii]|nr:hypothetical protein N7527_000709 [Penicillium freii]
MEEACIEVEPPLHIIYPLSVRPRKRLNPGFFLCDPHDQSENARYEKRSLTFDAATTKSRSYKFSRLMDECSELKAYLQQLGTLTTPPLTRAWLPSSS